MTNLLYNKQTLISRLYLYFQHYFSACSAPAAQNLFLLVLSILALESARSIRFLYQHFLSGITKKSLNAFYYVCSYAKVDYFAFMNQTAKLALNIIPKALAQHPVFLCVDDTMAAKFGDTFEHISTLFDHAAHNGSNYLKGHCFVSVVLCIPVFRQQQLHYLSVPLGYRMWTKSISKLELAAGMIRQVMPVFENQKNVIILCDSWYAKEPFVSVIEKYENLDVICNARSDSVLYDLPPAPTGKRGRPAKHGKRLSLSEDFTVSQEKIGNYHAASRRVLTNLFGQREVLACVTATDLNSGTRRLFLSTIFPEDLQGFCPWDEKKFQKQNGEKASEVLPLLCYTFRWNIEVSYYEQKTFWSLCDYRIKSCRGIEMFLNLVNIAYGAMKILPYQDTGLSKYQEGSTQEIRFAFSEQIRREVFIASFVENIENTIKSETLINAIKQLFIQKQSVL